MLKLLVVILMGSSFVFAGDNEFVTGIKWQSQNKCLKQHNARRKCYLKQMSPAGKCRQGDKLKTGDHSFSAVISCKKDKEIKNDHCLKIKKKFMNSSEVCSIANKDWERNKSCYAPDQHEIRSQLCAVGCDLAPSYHVCDWTQKQYQTYKYCSSVAYLTQQTRENICPEGMPDVGTTGPPPRLNITGVRLANQAEYLSFLPGFIIDISSIVGKKGISYCIKIFGDSTSCKNNDYLTPKHKAVDQSKLSLVDQALEIPAGTTFKIFIRNNTNKKVSTLNITKSKQTSLSHNGKGVWAELIGPDLTPVLAPNSTQAQKYIDHPACSPLYQEEKDISGRRWKCVDPAKYHYKKSSEHIRINYASYGGGDGMPTCQIENKCNSFGKWYGIMTCSGGATPADMNTNKKWEAFVFPGQYINYPEDAGSCNPNKNQ